MSIDLNPFICGLEMIQDEISNNNLKLEDSEALRSQLEAAEELILKIKSQIG